MRRALILHSRRGSTMLLALIFITFVGVTCSFGLWLLASAAAVHSRLTLVTQSAAYAAGSVATAEANLPGGIAVINTTAANERAVAFVNRAIANDPFGLNLTPGRPNYIDMTIEVYNILVPSNQARLLSGTRCSTPTPTQPDGSTPRVCWLDDLGQPHYSTGVQVSTKVDLCLIDAVCGQPWLPKWTIKSSGYSQFTVRQAD